MAKKAYDQDTSDWGSREGLLDNIKKATEERKEAFRKNVPSYIWTAIKDLLALVVILAIFNTALGSGETIFFALLILVYISLEGFFSSYTYKTTETVVGLADELFQIKKPLQHEENELETKKRKEALAVYLKLEINFFIHSILLVVVFLIVLVNLLIGLANLLASIT